MLLQLSPEDLQKVNQVKEILEKEYQKHVTHEDLAQRVNTYETRLRWAFKQVQGVTVHRFLTRVRINKAKELLENTDEPVKAISWMVGLETSNFGKLFKKCTGVSPSVWRTNAQRNQT